MHSQLRGLFYDLRFSLRGLLRDRAFTLTAVAMLALAVSLNVTAFTVAQAMLFRGMPLVKRNDRVVYMSVHNGGWSTRYSDFAAWRSQARAFEARTGARPAPPYFPGTSPDVLRGSQASVVRASSFEDMAFHAGGPITFRTGDGRLTDMQMERLTANTFGLLGVRPALGRDFSPADESAGAPPVAILSYRFWQNRFAGRADVVGQTVRVDDAAVSVIGVMPKGFALVYEQNLWMPLTHTAELSRKDFAGGAIGRLRDGATIQQARTELETINRRLQAADPTINRTTPPSVTDYSFYVGPDAPMIYGTLWAGACFVLLIACANLANLTLVRTIGRWREFATRVALGAGHTRLMRQVFMESLVLATVAGAIGWWIVNWAVPQWAAATAARYLVLDYRVDSGTGAYLIAIAAVAAVLCSLAPIIRIAQLGRNATLNIDSRSVTQTRRDKRFASGLVAGQMVLAIVLLSGAGVLVRSLLNIVEARTGVGQPEKILIGSMRVPSDKYRTPVARLAYFDRLSDRLRSLPGVEDVSVASTVPVLSGHQRTFEIEGRPNPPADAPAADFIAVTANYFRLVGAPPVAGRDFRENDQIPSPLVAVVNQSFAARFWPGKDAVGRRLRAVTRSQPGEWLTVVGVVPNMMHGDALRQRFNALVYVPFRQEPTERARDLTQTGFNGSWFLARTSVPPAEVAQAVRSEAQQLDPDVTLEEFLTLKASFGFKRDRMDLEHAELGKDAAMAPIFAGVALLLAAIGLYAVIAHSIGQRTKEIGVRMAIGAAARDIGRMVLRDGMLPVSLGIILGLAASFAVNRLLQSQLVGVSPYDLVTMAGAAALLNAVALFACQIPARRAMNVNPAAALRHD